MLGENRAGQQNKGKTNFNSGEGGESVLRGDARLWRHQQSARGERSHRTLLKKGQVAVARNGESEDLKQWKLRGVVLCARPLL